MPSDIEITFALFSIAHWIARAIFALQLPSFPMTFPISAFVQAPRRRQPKRTAIDIAPRSGAPPSCPPTALFTTVAVPCDIVFDQLYAFECRVVAIDTRVENCNHDVGTIKRRSIRSDRAHTPRHLRRTRGGRRFGRDRFNGHGGAISFIAIDRALALTSGSAACANACGLLTTLTSSDSVSSRAPEGTGTGPRRGRRGAVRSNDDVLLLLLLLLSFALFNRIEIQLTSDLDPRQDPKYERRSAQLIPQNSRSDSPSISDDSESPPSVVHLVRKRKHGAPPDRLASELAAEFERVATSRTHERHTYKSWPSGYPQLSLAPLSAPSVTSPLHLINSSPVSDSNAAEDLATCSLRSADSSSKIADRRSGI